MADLALPMGLGPSFYITSGLWVLALNFGFQGPYPNLKPSSFDRLVLFETLSS